MAFEGESVGLESIACSSSMRNQSSDHTNTKLALKIRGDTCFHCKNRGHWARDCPSKSPKRPEPSSSKEALRSHDLPNVQCPCGAGVCIVLVSKTPRNPDRKFYSCPASFASKCRFFRWCDEVRKDEISDAPVCGCGAGICRVSTETKGPHAGRKFYACPIKKGQGACNFFQWQDAKIITATNDHIDGRVGSPPSQLTICHEASSSSSNLVEEGDLNQQKGEIKLPVVDSVNYSLQLAKNSPTSCKDTAVLVELKCREDMVDGPCWKPYKCLQWKTPKIDNSVLDSATQCLDMPQPKTGDPVMTKTVEASEGEINCRQAFLPTALPATLVAFLNKYSLTDAFHQILGLHLQIWWGRLVFFPPRHLTAITPKPFFCCVFPSFDPIFVPGDDFSNAKASAIVSRSPSAVKRPKLSKQALVSHVHDDQLLDDVLWELPALKSPPNVALKGNIITKSITKAFGTAALHVQNDLCTLLESMDFQDHEAMVPEANSAFAALEQLSVDYGSIFERVKEFISRASVLAGIEKSILNDTSSRELVDRYNCEKERLDDISRIYAESADALKASTGHLQLLGKVTSRVKELLSKMEIELSSHEAENAELENRLACISQNVLKSQESFQAASEGAETALKLCQQRELARNAARAAFEMARSQLRP